MSSLARHLHTTLLAGVTEPASATAFRNLVVAWGPDGRIVATFEKVHRVPFGEYVPYRGFFAHFANLSAVPLTAVPGHGSGLLRTPAGPLGVLVSYEVFYADRSRPSVRAGAELLVVPTNASSYRASQVPAQEVAAARVQAVEEGRDLVQAAPTGFSAVVDNQGNVLQRSVLGRRQVLLATVDLRTGRTLYGRWGDLPVLALSALALAAGWLRDRALAPAEVRPLASLPVASTVGCRPVPPPVPRRWPGSSTATGGSWAAGPTRSATSAAVGPNWPRDSPPSPSSCRAPTRGCRSR